MRVELTHKGWFGICPVYFGRLDTEAPLVVERHKLFLPLMMVSEFVFGLALMFSEDPEWCLMITGELPPGRVLDVPA